MLRRLLFNPFTRMAIVTWAWNRRHEIKRWGLSLYNEIAGSGKVDPARLQQIAQVLWNVSKDPKLGNAKELRAVRLVGNKIEADVEPDWVYTSRLVNRLSTVRGITDVEVRGVDEPAVAAV